MARRGVSFELSGLSDLVTSLEGLRDDVRARLDRAVGDTATAIQSRARANVPRETGDLARSIAVEGRGLTRRVGLTDGPVSTRRGTDTAHLNPGIYGQFIEHGFKTKPARPFMGPAVDAEEANHGQRIETALDDSIGGAS